MLLLNFSFEKMFKIVFGKHLLQIARHPNNFMLLNVTKFILRICSTIANKGLTEWNNIKNKYSKKELKFILKTLNKCDANEMQKYGISENDIKLLESAPNKNKVYNSLDDFVLNNVIEVNQLENICTIMTSKSKEIKKPAIISPTLKKKNIHKLKTAAGLRIGSNYVSWSYLELTGSNCNLLQWNCQSISALPFNVSIAEVIKKGIDLASAIPDADAYVMEKEFPRSTQKINNSLLKPLFRQQQLMSIILTTLLTRNNRNEAFTDKQLSRELFSLRSHASAQHFGLLLGCESVSASDVVQCLLQQQNSGLENISSLLFDDHITNYYALINSYEKEELNKSLLLTLKFCECVIAEQNR